MRCYYCSEKTALVTVTMATVLSYPTLVYFIFREFDYESAKDFVVLHVMSSVAIFFGMMSCCLMIRFLLLGQYDPWRGSLVSIYGSVLFAATFEFQWVVMAVALMLWILTLFVLLYLDQVPGFSTAPTVEEMQPILEQATEVKVTVYD